MKIGIFGGSFNPPHNMHETIVSELIEKKYVDKVILVPVGDQYQKPDLISCNTRLHLLKLMFDSRKNVEVCDYELHHGTTYTFQLLDHFHHLYPKDIIFFICGSDNLKELDHWKNYHHILTNYQLLVVPRNNDNQVELLQTYNLYQKNISFVDISYTSISSTEIRREIKNNNYNFIQSKLSNQIVQYLQENQIYKLK